MKRITLAILFLGLALPALSIAQTRPPAAKLPAPQREALQILIEAGGVLIHADERQPDYPVLLVDFSNHPDLEESHVQALTAFPILASLGLAGTALTDEGLKSICRR